MKVEDVALLRVAHRYSMGPVTDIVILVSPVFHKPSLFGDGTIDDGRAVCGVTDWKGAGSFYAVLRSLAERVARPCGRCRW